MATPRRPNPYRDLPRQELYAACQHRAGELMGPPVRRTPAERAELALDTAHLLLAVAWWVERSEHTPQAPQRDLDNSRVSFVETWWQDYQNATVRCIADARRRTLLEAAEFARGTGGTRQWLEPGGGGYSLYDLGSRSDDGLRQALEQLESIYRRRKGW